MVAVVVFKHRLLNGLWALKRTDTEGPYLFAGRACGTVGSLCMDVLMDEDAWFRENDDKCLVEYTPIGIYGDDEYYYPLEGQDAL